jgi:ankyrin repeat protein
MELQNLSITARMKQNLLIGAVEKDNLTKAQQILSSEKKDVLNIKGMKNHYRRTFLHLAVIAKRYHLEFLKLFIEHGILEGEGASIVNARDQSDHTPLYLAVDKGCKNCMAVLIDHHSSLDDEDLLVLAIRKGHTECIELLIKKGARVNAINENTSSPLHVAVEYKNLQYVEMLIEGGADINATNSYLSSTNRGISTKYWRFNLTPLHLAILLSWIEGVEFLIVKGGDVNALASQENTALHFAVECKNLDCIKLLIDRGASINAINMFGLTPLHLATQMGWIEGVEFLIVKGANVNALARRENTALHFAAERKNLKCIEFLISGGASIDAINMFGLTPLHLAIQMDWIEGMIFLIDKGAKVNPLPGIGATAVHFALGCRPGSTITIAILAHHGASIEAINEEGYTPLHVAAEDGLEKCIEILISFGASVHATTEEGGDTPLHLAAENGHVESVKILLLSGANPLSKNKQGHSPFYLATQNGHTDCVRWLEQFVPEIRESQEVSAAHILTCPYGMFSPSSEERTCSSEESDYDSDDIMCNEENEIRTVIPKVG